MKLYKYTHQGKRGNNEDYQGDNKCVVTVCDGMGGHAAGEVASRFVVENVLKMFADKENDLTKDVINKRLVSIQKKLNDLLEKEPEKEGMGTTFTGVFRCDDFWYVAHIGDSRVYFVRPSEKAVWHTWDHSMVGDLMRHGDITREKGRNHPMANRISRAVLANSKGKTVIADVAKIDNLKKGDLFLLCSDGIGDAWRDDEICELLCDENIYAEKKFSAIREKCERESNDNNTAYLIDIEKEDEIDNGNNEELTWIPLSDLQENYQQYLRDEKEEAEAIQLDEGEQNTDENNRNPAAQAKPAEPEKSDSGFFMKHNNLIIGIITALMVLLVGGAVMYEINKNNKVKAVEEVINARNRMDEARKSYIDAKAKYNDARKAAKKELRAGKSNKQAKSEGQVGTDGQGESADSTAAHSE